MIDKETELNMTDWELSEDYYKEREGKQIPCWLRQSPM